MDRSSICWKPFYWFFVGGRGSLAVPLTQTSRRTTINGSRCCKPVFVQADPRIPSAVMMLARDSAPADGDHHEIR